MTAQRIGVFTIDFPDPSAINYENNKFTTLNDTEGFSYRVPSNIQTLSTKGTTDNDPYGILFVPYLRTDACKSNETTYVAKNATRLDDLPANKDYALIAIAPWFSPQCMLEYFAAARQVTTKAILVYQPGQGNAKPPVLNDVSWDLKDGGGWQSDNTFPTYAVSSITGAVIMEQLGLYSGNLSTVPDADKLSQDYDDTDYIRLWASVSTDSPGQLPSLWVFLVIVLALLVVAVLTTSVAMHVIQRRRRNDLRRRVLAGQVDLEALGVKRLKVSPEILEKLPIHTYTAGSVGNLEKSLPQPPAPALGLPSSSGDAEIEAKAALFRRASVPTTIGSAPSDAWSQGTCPICLDDFESNVTEVRELPCRHIFHPDCIDQFLLSNSSLCPMCKQSVLPVGACPVEITNMMVRRERHINRMRARGGTLANASEPSAANSAPTSRLPGALGSLGSRLGGAMAGRRIFSAPERTSNRPSDIEMATTNPTIQQPEFAYTQPANPTPTTSPPANLNDCAPTQNRREWARQRALQLLGNRHVPSEVEDEDRGPRWRRTLRKAFPGFR